jgi:putative DNA primase/helicase
MSIDTTLDELAPGAWALAYAAEGWPVFPCAAGAKRAKAPLISRGLHAATTDERQVATWWRRWPDALIGLPTERLVVVDIDGPEGLTSWRNLHPDASRPIAEWSARTQTVRTPRGGYHLYFAPPPGAAFGNRAGYPGASIDIRAAGGYVIAPPSRMTSGGTYEDLSTTDRLEALPDWLAHLLTADRPRSDVQPAPAPRPPAGASRYAAVALRDELRNVREAAEGTRNNTLNQAAFALGQLVGAGLLGEDATVADLVRAAAGAGLKEGEAFRTITSGMRQGKARPRVVEQR